MLKWSCTQQRYYRQVDKVRAVIIGRKLVNDTKIHPAPSELVVLCAVASIRLLDHTNNKFWKKMGGNSQKNTLQKGKGNRGNTLVQNAGNLLEVLPND